MKNLLIFFFSVLAFSAFSEEALYGSVELRGLARDSWDLNHYGHSNEMVCNVNGPEGYLSVREGPGTNYAIKRKLNRLAVVVVDTTVRSGRWIKVLDAHRSFSIHGQPQTYKSLFVTGWVHDSYLCDFTSY